MIIEKIKNAKCVEISDKMDGSMQSARWYNNEIIMSGSQSIDKEQSWRLADGYNMLINDKQCVKMIIAHSEYTYIFEYISLKDAHVVNYTKEQEGLYLLGMRNIYTGGQLSYKKVKEYAEHFNVKMEDEAGQDAKVLAVPTNKGQLSYKKVKEYAEHFNVKVTKLFDKTFDEIMADVDKYKSHEKEGYVMNIDGHYVKIKTNDYVQIHKVLSNISSINLIIKAIADDTFDDLISKVPDSYRWRVDRVAKLVLNYIETTKAQVNYWFTQAPKYNIKEFMIWIDKNVPVEYRGYIRNKYLGKENNYIKSGNSRCPSYKKLKDMGINENYSAIFVQEE